MKKCYPDYQFEVNLRSEWSLWVQQLGKIILITGPQSSGKTSLTHSLVKTIPNLYTINRKAISFNLVPELDKLFFNDILSEARKLTGKELKDGYELLQLRNIDIDASVINEVNLLKNQQQEILTSKKFNQTYFILSFEAYYVEIKKYIFSGYHVVLDESFINSDKMDSMFRYCCDYYPNIKRILLFDTIEGIYNKNVIRNTKFAEVLSKENYKKSIDQVIKEIEINNGGSAEIYRLPESILKDYKEYYTFKTKVTDGDIVLGEITKKELLSIINKISIEQLKISGLLGYRGYAVKRDFIEVNEEAEKILAGSSKAYIISKTNPDHVINGSIIPATTLLNNLFFIANLLNSTIQIPSISAIYPEEGAYNENQVLLPVLKKGNIHPNSTQLKYILDNKLDARYKSFILTHPHNIAQLDNTTKTLIKEVFEGKFVIILFEVHDGGHLSELIIHNKSKNHLECIYYNSAFEKLENNLEGLLLILFLHLNVQELNLQNVFVDVRDLTRKYPKNFDTENWHHFINFPQSLDISYKEMLLQEWSLWSKCFGKVVVINGVSSSGKTTLANYFQYSGFHRISIDDIYDQLYKNYLSSTIPDLIFKLGSFLSQSDFWKMLLQYQINLAQYSDYEQEDIIELQTYLTNNSEQISATCPSDMEIYDIIYEKSKKFIFSGQNVVIDLVMVNDTQVDLFSFCFNNYPVSTILLYLPLEENLKQCFLRNHNSSNKDLVDCRFPNQVLDLYLLFYKFITKEKVPARAVQLDRVNKDAIINILDHEIYDNLDLLSEIYDYAKYSKERQRCEYLVEKFRDIIEIEKDRDLFVVPLVKSDFIINSLKLRQGLLYQTQKLNLLELLSINLENHQDGHCLFVNESLLEFLGEDGVFMNLYE